MSDDEVVRVDMRAKKQDAQFRLRLIEPVVGFIASKHVASVERRTHMRYLPLGPDDLDCRRVPTGRTTITIELYDEPPASPTEENPQ